MYEKKQSIMPNRYRVLGRLIIHPAPPKIELVVIVIHEQKDWRHYVHMLVVLLINVRETFETTKKKREKTNRFVFFCQIDCREIKYLL